MLLLYHIDEHSQVSVRMKMEAFMEDGFTRRQHAVYKLVYHAVFVTKYRRKVIDQEIMAFIRGHAEYLINECYHGKFMDLNGEEDHIHVLFELPASIAPSVAVCSLKTQLSKEVRKRYMDRIQDKLWKDSFWSDSYFLSTTGGANLEVLEKYVQDQGIERPKRKYTKKREVK